MSPDRRRDNQRESHKAVSNCFNRVSALPKVRHMSPVYARRQCSQLARTESLIELQAELIAKSASIGTYRFA